MAENLNGLNENYITSFVRHIHKKWFIYFFGVAAALLFAFVYLRFSQKEYIIKSRILISEVKENNKTSQSEVLEDYSLTSSPNSVENTINSLTARIIVDSTVKKMGLFIRYFGIGNFIDREIEPKFQPVYIETISYGESRFVVKEFTFSIIDSSRFTLVANGSYRAFHFDDIVDLGFGKFRFHFKSQKETNNYKLLIRFFNLDETVNFLTRNLSILPTSKSASTIDISLIDNLPDRGEDILVNFLTIFNRRQKNEKARNADSSIAFIDNRLNLLVNELDSVEQKIQSYRQNNELADVSAQRKLQLDNSSQNQNEASKYRVKLKAIDQLLALLKNSQPHSVPAAMIIDDRSFAQMAENYNDLQLKRDELIKNSGANNPKVAETSVKIENLRKDIIGSLTSIHNFIKSSVSDLEKRTGATGEQLQQAAVQDRTFLEFSRRQRVKEELYLYLLKKREAVAISKSLNFDELNIVDPPRAMSAPFRPKSSIIYLAALAIGFAVPAFGFYLKSVLKRNIRNAKSMLATIDIPLIGEIASANKDFMLNPMQLKSPVAEQFRRLEFNLNSKLIDGRRAQTFLLTSHSRKEGKSFISFNLSRFFAALGSKTVLVECDLRRPRLARLMAVKTEYGITDYVCYDKVPMGEIIYQIPSAENCWFIPAGQQIADPIETLRSEKIAAMFYYLKAHFDTIIVDTPPFGSVIDPLILSGYADVNLYVVREDNTEIEQLRNLQEFQKHSSVKDLRIIINHAKINKKYGYGYGYK